jgi:hypothetical protein
MASAGPFVSVLRRWTAPVGILGAATVLALVTAAGPALADGGGGGGRTDIGSGHGDFNVTVPGGSKSGNSGGGGRQAAYDPNATVCIYTTAYNTVPYRIAAPPAGQTAADGQSMTQICGPASSIRNATGADPFANCAGCGAVYGLWVRNATPSPAQIAADQFAHMGLNKPNIHTSPDAAHHLVVTLPTWLWVDGKRGDQHSTQGAITITAKQKVVWTTDEGAVSCSGPGTPYVVGKSDPKAASPDCGVTFKKPGTGKWVKAVVTWTGSFTVGGGAPVNIPAPITFTVNQPLAVDEVQTVN